MKWGNSVHSMWHIIQLTFGENCNCCQRRKLELYELFPQLSATQQVKNLLPFLALIIRYFYYSNASSEVALDFKRNHYANSCSCAKTYYSQHCSPSFALLPRVYLLKNAQTFHHLTKKNLERKYETYNQKQISPALKTWLVYFKFHSAISFRVKKVGVTLPRCLLLLHMLSYSERHCSGWLLFETWSTHFHTFHLPLWLCISGVLRRSRTNIIYHEGVYILSN